MVPLTYHLSKGRCIIGENDNRGKAKKNTVVFKMSLLEQEKNESLMPKLARPVVLNTKKLGFVLPNAFGDKRKILHANDTL